MIIIMMMMMMMMMIIIIIIIIIISVAASVKRKTNQLDLRRDIKRFESRKAQTIPEGRTPVCSDEE